VRGLKAGGIRLANKQISRVDALASANAGRKNNDK
jgi:hypothetical protein